MSKKIIWAITIAIILIVGGFLYTKNSSVNKHQGLAIEQPTINQEVKLPLTIKGEINGNGWTAFEGVVGSVQLFDENGKEITERTPLQATEDWMQTVVHFETTIGDAGTMKKISTQTGVLVFKNENTKGDSADDKEFRLPIKFTK